MKLAFACCMWIGKANEQDTLLQSKIFVASNESLQAHAGWLQNKGPSGCTQSSKCRECYGDCDSDKDCETGLKCYQRSHGEAVPGCGTGGPDNYDFCYDPGDALKELGWSGCTKSNQCSRCQGDCDHDIHCKFPLTCFHRGNTETVPGCGSGGTQSYDFCHDPGQYTLSSHGEYIGMGGRIEGNDDKKWPSFGSTRVKMRMYDDYVWDVDNNFYLIVANVYRDGRDDGATGCFGPMSWRENKPGNAANGKYRLNGDILQAKHSHSNCQVGWDEGKNKLVCCTVKERNYGLGRGFEKTHPYWFRLLRWRK